MAGITDSIAQFRVEPPNWWVGMQRDTLQLMIHGMEVGLRTPSLEYPGLRVAGWQAGDSPNYLFLDLVPGPEVSPGNLTIRLLRDGVPDVELAYELLPRARKPESFAGFDASDVLYLITPDRFANGDPGNDSVGGMREAGVDRKRDYARHGGDIRGIIDNLDYLHTMGFTAIWPSPLLVNDMPESSYHGYAITDYYRVDPRFGDLESYRELAQEAYERGIKLVMDQVVNHCGLYHWWMDDLPFGNWIHFQESWEKGEVPATTNHRRTVNQDRYAADADRDLMDRGWFVPSMPDLNQGNPYLATYLIQNSIWWVESLGLGGIRQDTYPYPDKTFMAEWAKAVMDEYPNFTIVGEEWSYNPLLVAYWQDGAVNPDGYRSHLRSTMDFPLQRALVQALTAEEGCESGLNVLYEALANDFHYPRPSDLLFFGDNHDMDRLYTQLGGSDALMEMALAFILTAPRIPQIYYGTEILMENDSKPGDHGRIRGDFPGGWKGDAVNAFTGAGLTSAQSNFRDRLRRMLQFRKANQVLHLGSTIHFAPENGVYVLARKSEGAVVVLILNKNKAEVQLPTARFRELGLDGVQLRDILSNDPVLWADSLILESLGTLVLALPDQYPDK